MSEPEWSAFDRERMWRLVLQKDAVNDELRAEIIRLNRHIRVLRSPLWIGILAGVALALAGRFLTL